MRVPHPPLAASPTALCGLLGAALLGACSDSTLKALEPTVVVEPEVIVFDGLVVGEPASARVRVGNTGRADLHLDGVEIDGPFHVRTEPVTLPSGATELVWVELTPTGSADHTAELVVRTDDPERPEVRVPVTAAPRAPEIRATPTEVSWPDAETGASSS